MPRLPFTAHSIPFALSPRLFISGASRIPFCFSLRLSGRSPRLPSVTPERFSFSGYLSLPRRTSAIRFAARRPPRIGHTRLTLSRYHICVPVRSDRYVISVQCLRSVPRSVLRPSSSISHQDYVFPYYFSMLERYVSPECSSPSFVFTLYNIHLSSLTYLVPI